MYYFTNVLLKSFHSVRADDKPEFERAKPTTQRNAPMLLSRKTQSLYKRFVKYLM